jgi:hypothetical protein
VERDRVGVMSAIGATVVPAAAPLSVCVRAAVAAMPALFIVVLTHEGGHLVTYRLFDFPRPTLHSDSASYSTQDRFWTLIRAGQRAEAARLVPLPHVGLAAGAGIAMTLVSAALALYAIRSAAWRPFWLAVAVLAPVRFLVGIPAVVALIRGLPLSPTSDEGEISMLLGWHPGWLALCGLVVMVACWLLTVRNIRRTPNPIRLVVSTMVGAVAGGVVYARWLGPWLLG